MKFNLNSSQIEILKMSALFFMLVDHFYRFLPQYNFNYFTFEIGRLAFPLFAFLFTYNFKCSKDRFNKMIKRLAIFSILAQITFFIFGMGINPIDLNFNGNVLFTFLVAIILIFYIKDKLLNNFVASILIFINIVIVSFDFFNNKYLEHYLYLFDYGISGSLFIYYLYYRKYIYSFVFYVLSEFMLITNSEDKIITITLIVLVPLILYFYIKLIEKIKIEVKRLPKYSFYILYVLNIFMIYILEVFLEVF